MEEPRIALFFCLTPMSTSMFCRGCSSIVVAQEVGSFGMLCIIRQMFSIITALCDSLYFTCCSLMRFLVVVNRYVFLESRDVHLILLVYRNSFRLSINQPFCLKLALDC